MGLSWSRNGRYLASVGWDSQLVLWNVLEGTVVRGLAALARCTARA